MNSNWVGAGHLKIGDKIKQADGTTGVVANVTTVQQTQEMFNLTVDEAHTFYVGTNGWLVHNTGGPGCGPWSFHPTTRGQMIEDELAATEYAGYDHVGKLQKGYFPAVDFWGNGSDLVSIKTIDPRGTSTSWIGDMQWHIDSQLKRLQIQDTVTGAFSKPNSITLDIRVPDAASAQRVLRAISPMVRNSGVTLKVKVFP